jgi:hypothetical protein
LAELEEVAAEAGIDVAQLRQAAHELDTEQALQPRGTAARLAGAPLRGRCVRTLPFEVDDAALGALVQALSAITDDAGEARQVGRTFTWRVSRSGGRRTDVHVSVRGGATTVQVEERYAEFAGGLFGGVIGGVGGGAGIGGGTAIGAAAGSLALGIAIPAAVIAGSYAACRAGFAAYVRRRSVEIDRMCEQIVQELTALHDPAP